MGPGEVAIVLVVAGALAAGTWASRDARLRTGRESTALLVGALALLTFPLGPAVYARLRHRLG